MAFQGRHQIWSGLHKINSDLLEGQGEEAGVSGLKGTDLQVQLPSPLPIMFPWLCRLRQCPHSTSASAIIQGQSITSPLPGSSFAESAGTVPALSLVVLAGAQGLTALQTRERVTDAPRQCPRPLGSVAVLKEAGCRLCKHNSAVLMAKPQHRLEERCITVLSLQLHHRGVWTVPPALCIEAHNWGVGGRWRTASNTGGQEGLQGLPFYCMPVRMPGILQLGNQANSLLIFVVYFCHAGWKCKGLLHQCI